MENPKVFISVGATANNQQEQFVRLIETRLQGQNLSPCTVGRNNFSASSPLQTVKELMNECSGILIIALERTFFEVGIEKRGGPQEINLRDVRLATPWNQIEAGMAYLKGLPILVILESGVKGEGLLEKGYDWYVMNVDLGKQSLDSLEFNGVLSSWKRKVEEYQESKANKIKANFDVGDLTIGDLVTKMKPAQLWAVLAGLLALLTGVFVIGQHFRTP